MTHYFANVLYLSFCMLGNCSCFYFRLLTFFKIKFLKINHPGSPSECQTIWIQIKTDILLVFIWVQTFPMLNGTLSFLQKYLFLLLSFQFCIIYVTCSKNVQVASKLSPQKYFINKTYFVFKTISSIIVIC